MSWFIFALIATLGWGFADLFYKKGTDETDRYSHLKTAVWVGIVMGAASFVLLFAVDRHYSAKELLVDAIKYSPASLGYILSMIIGYAGMRHLEISIISPVQNASGALSAVVMIVYFIVSGKYGRITDSYSALEIIGTVVIVIGIIRLAVAENELARKEKSFTDKDKRKRVGASALIFPLAYCLFDTLGTSADGIILDGETGLGLSEITVLILYGFTFFAAGLLSFLFLSFKQKKVYNPFERNEIKTKGCAALCEEFGQIFYVYAMAANPVLAAPMISSYCIVSVILSRVILKERLKPIQYISVGLVIAGIVTLGVSEGLAEL